MLIQFSVKNFMSIKDKVIFSMLASSDKENKENIIESGNENYLKSAVIYGANASGKSNLIKAIRAVKIMVVNSNNMQPNTMLPIVPFKFNEKSLIEPSEFELIMLINNIKYVYGFKADMNKVYEEYLYYYPNGRETEIFERTNVNDYHFTQAENKLNDIKSKNIENKLFLATATTWNYEKTKPVYEFIANEISVVFDYEGLRVLSFEQYANDITGELKKFSLGILNKTDININDYDVSNIEMTDEQLATFPVEIRPFFSKGIKGYSVSTNHNIKDENGNIKSSKLDFEDESLGTQNMFILNPLLLKVLKNGEILVVDELDKSLHPFLVKYIVSLFNSEEYNKKGAQLIFNTHDTNLLSLDLFRRDQIWFTEKNSENGETDLYPLDDFSVRKLENIQKGYLNGRYGAIPFISTGDGLWEEK